VGLGRAYVKLDPGDGPLDYDQWAYGIRDGRSYCCDGLSHLIDFKIRAGDEELGVGEKGAGGRASFMKIKSGQKLKASVRAAAMLQEKPREDIRSKPLDQKPYWHVERARIADTRNVPVELIVNGESYDTQEMEADGEVTDLEFEFEPEESCWVALRIFPSSHTNPVFVEVDDRPIRASKRSAQWCLDAVDVCWEHKQGAIRESEQPAAKRAYEEARQAYRKILAESIEDRGF
jgi:hypothetical protein